MKERSGGGNLVPEMIELWHQLTQQKVESIDEDEDLYIFSF